MQGLSKRFWQSPGLQAWQLAGGGCNMFAILQQVWCHLLPWVFCRLSSAQAPACSCCVLYMLWPHTMSSHPSHLSLSFRLRVNMGNIYFTQGKFAPAIKMYRMALDSLPGGANLPRARILRNIGAAFVRMGQYGDAAGAFEQVMERAPDHQVGGGPGPAGVVRGALSTAWLKQGRSGLAPRQGMLGVQVPTWMQCISYV